MVTGCGQRCGAGAPPSSGSTIEVRASELLEAIGADGLVPLPDARVRGEGGGVELVAALVRPDGAGAAVGRVALAGQVAEAFQLAQAVVDRLLAEVAGGRVSRRDHPRQGLLRSM